MVYMITYDLNKTGQDYDKVIDAIKSASTDDIWCSNWKSSWLIQSNLPTANQVYEIIKPYIDRNDTILVIEVKNNMEGCLDEEMWEYITRMF